MIQLTEFTKEHLIEIEKIFDIQAGNVLQVTSALANAGKGTPGMDDMVQKAIKEMTHSFDTYRTISTIAKIKREEQ